MEEPTTCRGSFPRKMLDGHLLVRRTVRTIPNLVKSISTWNGELWTKFSSYKCNNNNNIKKKGEAKLIFREKTGVRELTESRKMNQREDRGLGFGQPEQMDRNKRLEIGASSSSSLSPSTRSTTSITLSSPIKRLLPLRSSHLVCGTDPNK